MYAHKSRTGTVPNSIDVDEVAHQFPGIAGGDIANALLVSALKTAREERAFLKQSDFTEALSRILQSKQENKGKKVTIESRQVTEEYARAQLAAHQFKGE